MTPLLKDLHELEDRLIEISGLMKALQEVVPDDALVICLTNVLEEKLDGLQQHFYSHWGMVVKHDVKAVAMDKPSHIISEPIYNSHNLTEK